jgi:large subunit ribosomal protein L23
MNILIKPVITEKMTADAENLNRFGFVVDRSANKIQIKKAVEEKFKVKVLKVAVSNRKGKAKQMTVKSNGKTIRTNGYTKLKKRAIVTLVEGYNIDLFSV